MPTLWSRLRAATLIVVTAVLVPTAVFAADTDLEDSQTDIFDLSPQAVALITGALLPLLVGLVTKSSTSSKLKGALLITLSAVAGVIAQATVDGGGAVFSQETLLAAGIAWVAAVATHFGFWQPTGATAKVQSVGVKD